MNLNVADSFLSFINHPQFLERVEVIYSENMKWSALHFVIARQFLGEFGFFKFISIVNGNYGSI